MDYVTVRKRESFVSTGMEYSRYNFQDIQVYFYGQSKRCRTVCIVCYNSFTHMLTLALEKAKNLLTSVAFMELNKRPGRGGRGRTTHRDFAV